MGTIVILHGWGISGKRYEVIQGIFEKKGYKVLSPDFPGFGKTSLAKKAMTLDDYVYFLKEYLKAEVKGSVILLGHSFGGRVAAKFVAENPEKVKALILTGAPLIKKPLPFHKQIVQTIVGAGKKFVPPFLNEIIRKNIYRLLGEWDYYKAGVLKQTLRNILAEDVSPNLPKITVPTLLIWGENDTFVSVRIGKEIAEIIAGSHLEIIKNASHKLPYENPQFFAEKVLAFLKKTV